MQFHSFCACEKNHELTILKISERRNPSWTGQKYWALLTFLGHSIFQNKVVGGKKISLKMLLAGVLRFGSDWSRIDTKIWEENI